MAKTYHQESWPHRERECDYCGANADVLLVADAEDENGYVVERAFCRKCWKTKARVAINQKWYV